MFYFDEFSGVIFYPKMCHRGSWEGTIFNCLIVTARKFGEEKFGEERFGKSSLIHQTEAKPVGMYI